MTKGKGPPRKKRGAPFAHPEPALPKTGRLNLHHVPPVPILASTENENPGSPSHAYSSSRSVSWDDLNPSSLGYVADDPIGLSVVSEQGGERLQLSRWNGDEQTP